MKDRHTIDDRVAEDLRALRLASERDLPTWEETVQAARRRIRGAGQEGIMSQTLGRMRARPWLATAVGVAVAALVLLLIPVSYDRTVGHEISVEVSGGEFTREDVREMTRDLEASLEVEGVQVALDDSRLVLKALTPSLSRSSVEHALVGFANSLAGRGLRAATRVQERVETVSGSVYAMAGNKIMELRIPGGARSAQEIEAELRAQLEEAGVTDADISVRVEGDQTTIELGWAEGFGDDVREERIKIMRRGEGEEECVVPVRQLEFERQPGMTDEEFRDYVIRELEAIGMDGAEVIVEDGQVRIRVEKADGCP